MDRSSFWQDRRALVLGGTGFLGSAVVRTLLDRGAAVSTLVRDSGRNSEFFTQNLFDAVHVSRGAAGRDRLRTLLTVLQPAVVFQLASVAGQPRTKANVTADLLQLVAEFGPDTRVIVPVAATEPRPRFQNHADGRLRVGFVTLPQLFGEGPPSRATWAGLLFQAAAARRPLPALVQPDAAFTHVRDAAASLLAAAELLTTLPEAPADGLWLEPPATATARQLWDRVSSPLAVADRLGDAVRTTLGWYERNPQGVEQDVPARRAA
jgi:nucleoside-diphosphate-sugar epimerase